MLQAVVDLSQDGFVRLRTDVKLYSQSSATGLQRFHRAQWKPLSTTPQIVMASGESGDLQLSATYAPSLQEQVDLLCVI